MANNIQIDNQNLLVLLELDDNEYQKIMMCLDEEDRKVFVINDKIVTDKSIIDSINKKYDLELLDELKDSIF